MLSRICQGRALRNDTKTHFLGYSASELSPQRRARGRKPPGGCPLPQVKLSLTRANPRGAHPQTPLQRLPALRSPGTQPAVFGPGRSLGAGRLSGHPRLTCTRAPGPGPSFRRPAPSAPLRSDATRDWSEQWSRCGFPAATGSHALCEPSGGQKASVRMTKQKSAARAARRPPPAARLAGSPRGDATSSSCW